LCFSRHKKKIIKGVVRKTAFVMVQGQNWRLRLCPPFLLLDIGWRHGRTMRNEREVMGWEGDSWSVDHTSIWDLLGIYEFCNCRTAL